MIINVNKAFESLAKFDAAAKLINQHQFAINDLGLCRKSFIHFLKSPMKAKLPEAKSGEEMKLPEHTWGMEMTHLNFNGLEELLLTIVLLCPNVKKLIFNSAPIPGESIKSLAQMIKHLTTALRNLPNLTELYCDRINIGKEREMTMW